MLPQRPTTLRALCGYSTALNKHTFSATHAPTCTFYRLLRSERVDLWLSHRSFPQA